MPEKSINQRISTLEKESTDLEKQLQEQPITGSKELILRLGSLTARLVHCLNLFS